MQSKNRTRGRIARFAPGVRPLRSSLRSGVRDPSRARDPDGWQEEVRRVAA
jgi:hypothetical protein